MKHIKLLISFIILGLVFSGCSKEMRYKTLTFFFDGVPDTVAPANSSDSVLQAGKNQPEDTVLPAPETNKFIHPPYQDRECDICHAEGALTMPQPQLCYQCHEDFSTKYTFVHGPVAGGYCTACHHPHMGNKYLLIRKGQDICLFCHEKKQVFKNENHDGIGNTNCTECHNPHGGEDRHFFN